jgi:hypothetical protein
MTPETITTAASKTASNHEDRTGGSSAERSRIRVLVVDDHPAIRMGLSKLLEDQADFVAACVVAEAESRLWSLLRTIVSLPHVSCDVHERRTRLDARRLRPRP